MGTNMALDPALAGIVGVAANFTNVPTQLFTVGRFCGSGREFKQAGGLKAAVVELQILAVHGQPEAQVISFIFAICHQRDLCVIGLRSICNLVNHASEGVPFYLPPISGAGQRAPFFGIWLIKDADFLNLIFQNPIAAERFSKLFSRQCRGVCKVAGHGCVKGPLHLVRKKSVKKFIHHFPRLRCC